MEYELQRAARECAATGRQFEPGEAFFSVLVTERSELRRYDYAVDAWRGPPDDVDVVGWWRSHMPGGQSTKTTWAPSDVMLDLFDRLRDQDDQRDALFVLALLLVRRRIMRLESSEETDATGGEVLLLRCSRRDAEYRVPVAQPSPDRVEVIQQRLAALLQ